MLAKLFTLFDERGGDMDRACLATFLAEALLIPSTALEPYIRWEAMDDLHAKATIEAYGLSCSEEGEMLSFSTDDRVATAMDGKKERIRWTALLADYQMKGDLVLPTPCKGFGTIHRGTSSLLTVGTSVSSTDISRLCSSVPQGLRS